MTTYNTGNPLGSSAAKDLFDNAQNLDHLSNDMDNKEWADRFGRLRKTWFGLESMFAEAVAGMGYITMDSFQVGASLTLANQALRWKLPDGDGDYYRWDGAFPKTVPANSTPASTGGVGSGKWIGVGDAALRGQLASSTDGAGDSLIAVKQPFAGAVARTQHDLNADYVNVKDFGALGDGTGAPLSTKYPTLAAAQVDYPFVTDLATPIDTAAIEAAWLAVTRKGSKYFPQHPIGESILNWASVNGPKLYFPAGRYIYRGAGLNFNDTVNQVPFVAIEGESKSSTEIWLDGDMYLVDSAINPYLVDVSNFKVYGGLGLLKFSSAAQNQVQLSKIENILFTAFRECALGFSSQDWPNIKIRDLQFYPRAGYQTICIMLSGWSANSEITGCEFGLAEGAGLQSYGIKLNIAAADSGGYRGPTTPILIADNGTYRRNNVDGSTSLWIVPNPSTNDNAGRAVVLRGNKWGAENVNSGTYHILIADENTGGTWGGNKRHITSKSIGYVRGLVLDKNNIRFEPNQTQPYIASYTPHIQGLVCEDIIDNTLPVMMIEYRGGMVYSDFNPQDMDNLISTRYWLAPTATNYSGSPVSNVSNIPGTVRIIDEKNYLNVSSGTSYPGESSVIYRNLMTLANSASGTANGMTKTVIDNSIGIPGEAVSLVASANSSRITYPLQNWDANRIIWVEIEPARGDTNPIGSISIELLESDTIKYFKRIINLTSEWKLYRVPVVLPAGATTASLRIAAAGYTASATTLKLGRVAMYHASEPINTGHLRSIGSAWNSQHITLGGYHLWIDGAGVLRIKNGVPLSGVDGVAVGSQI